MRRLSWGTSTERRVPARYGPLLVIGNDPYGNAYWSLTWHWGLREFWVQVER